MKRLFAAAAAALLLSAGAARADDAAVAEDVGLVLTIQLYSVGVMDYCYTEIEQRQSFKDASQRWQQRNAEAMTLQATMLPKVAKAEEIAALVAQVRNQIAFDIAGQSDKPAACQRAADSLNSPTHDITAQVPDSVARIKAAVAAAQ